MTIQRPCQIFYAPQREGILLAQDNLLLVLSPSVPSHRSLIEPTLVKIHYSSPTCLQEFSTLEPVLLCKALQRFHMADELTALAPISCSPEIVNLFEVESQLKAM